MPTLEKDVYMRKRRNYLSRARILIVAWGIEYANISIFRNLRNRKCIAYVKHVLYVCTIE